MLGRGGQEIQGIVPAAALAKVTPSSQFQRAWRLPKCSSEEQGRTLPSEAKWFLQIYLRRRDNCKQIRGPTRWP